MKKIILLVLFVTVADTFAQYSLAPEVWSVPEKIAVISEYCEIARSPTINWDNNRLYFAGIAVTEKIDTGWTIPMFLNNNINRDLSRDPCISPDEKRLFFSMFYPGNDINLFYSNWDSTTNDWGVAVNCGSQVNTPEYAENGCTLPNDTTLIFLRTSTSYISHWNKEAQIWGAVELWPTQSLWFTSDWGIYVSPDFKKVYDIITRQDTTINGESYLNYDIAVSYKDSTNPMGYKPPKILNICLYADTQYFTGNYFGRFEGFPTLTPDGKKMYFTADYDSQTTIYQSSMLIDENGNPVSVNTNYPRSEIIPERIMLFPAYPNPFNPITKIQYAVDNSQFVSLKVFDILGRQVATLVNEEKPSGVYEVEFNATNLSSGTYFYQLQAGEFISTKKLVLLK